MSRFDEIAFLKDLSTAYPGVFEKMWPFLEAVMRSDAPISREERELIATYVSALNQCSFCHGVHAHVARIYGVNEDLIDAMATDIETAPIDVNLKPLLQLAKVLTEAPAKVTDGHYEKARDAGWDDQAIGFAIGVTALFNMMNRLVEGFGIALPEDGGAGGGQVLATQGYDRSDP